MEININIIKQLIESIDKSNVDKICLKTQDFDITLEKNQRVYAEAKPIFTSECHSPVKSANAGTPNTDEISVEQEGEVIKAPIIGTFYASPAPKEPPFVTVGQKVQQGDVIFIIESMKLMNEVTSEYSGTVAEIYIKTGDTVEYGQPIMRIE